MWLENAAGDLSKNYTALPVFADPEQYWRVQAQVHNVRFAVLLRGACTARPQTVAAVARWRSPAWSNFVDLFPPAEQSAARTARRRAATRAVPEGLRVGDRVPAAAPAGRYLQALAAVAVLTEPDRSAVVARALTAAAAEAAAAGLPDGVVPMDVATAVDDVPCGQATCTQVAPGVCHGREGSDACLAGCGDAILPRESRQRVDWRIALLADHYDGCREAESE